MVLKNTLTLSLLLAVFFLDLSAQELEEELQTNVRYTLLVKQPGNPTPMHVIQAIAGQNRLQAEEEILLLP